MIRIYGRKRYYGRGIVPYPKGKFLEVECGKCQNISIVFSKCATKVTCDECAEELAQTTGGQAHIKGKILNVLR